MDEKQPRPKMIYQDLLEGQQEELDILVQREILQVQRIQALKENNEHKTVGIGAANYSPANSPRPKVKVPEHRDVVAKWMNDAVLFGLEFSQENYSNKPSTGPRLFTLAASLMDMFLLKCKIRLTQLQLLGSACLSLAAKSRKIQLSENALIACSDYALTSEEIQVSTFHAICS